MIRRLDIIVDRMIKVLMPLICISIVFEVTLLFTWTVFIFFVLVLVHAKRLSILRYFLGEQYVIDIHIDQIKMKYDKDISLILEKIKEYYDTEADFSKEIYFGRLMSLDPNYKIWDIVRIGVVPSTLVLVVDRFTDSPIGNGIASTLIAITLILFTIIYFYVLMFIPNNTTGKDRYLEKYERKLLESKINEYYIKDKVKNIF